MALTQRLEFRQSQSLVMTPQLMQAIKLVQLSNLDLSAFVEEELERNPLLERESEGPEAAVAGEASAGSIETSESGFGEEGGGGGPGARGGGGRGRPSPPKAFWARRGGANRRFWASPAPSRARKNG